MKLILPLFLTLCLALTSKSRRVIVTVTEMKIDEDFIPYIVGLSLMGFVIIFLLGSIVVCFCIRRDKKKDECNNSFELENVKGIKYDVRNQSPQNDHVDIPLPTLYKTKVTKLQKQNLSTLSFRGCSSYRRASVPATLSVLEEAPSYMEEGSRRISLSYNCLTEPLDKKSKDSVSVTDDEKLYMFDYLQANHARPTQSLVENSLNVRQRKYSIYDDESTRTDDYFSKFGKIYFSIHYDCDARTLSVTLLRAQHLVGHRIKGNNRFYVKLRLTKAALQQSISTVSLSGISESTTHKKEKINIRHGFRSTIKSDFCNPVFEETFTFTNVTSVTLTEYVLQFVVKEETPKFLDKNLVIGYVDFILKNAELNTKHECVSDIHRDLIPVGVTPNKGEAVLSLHYNRELAIISACVLELIVGNDDLSAVTIELYTRSIDNVIHKRKTHLKNNLRSSDVVEFPMDNCFLNSVCLVAVIFARVRNCSKTVYGRFVVGPIRFTDGPGLNHWAEMTIGNQMSIMSHKIV